MPQAHVAEAAMEKRDKVGHDPWPDDAAPVLSGGQAEYACSRGE